MIPKIIYGLKTFILITIFFTARVRSQENPIYVEGLAAIVGENVILKSDLSQIVTMTAIQQKIDPTLNPEIFLKLQENILQSLIDQKIVLEMAILDSLEVKEKDVDAVLDQQIENMIAQAGSEEKAETMLGQSIKSFRREFWYDMRDQLITEQYQQTLLSSVNVNRDDVVEFFATYKDSIPPFPTLVKLRHLLIPIEPGEHSKQQAFALLDSLRQCILGGESFAKQAEIYSQDPGTRTRGGDLGFVRRGALVQEFETVAFTLEVGTLSQPTETTFGLHLIETLEKQGDKVHVRHILITPQITIDDESRAYKFASSLQDSAITLDKFKTLVSSYSEDEKTKDIGGDLGWIDPYNYPLKEISQAIQYLTSGACSPPVKTDFGYHLLWFEAIKPGGEADLSTHWYEIESMALNQKKMRWYQALLQEARNNFYIKVIE